MRTLGIVIIVLASTSMAGKKSKAGKHPHFDDKGALPWFTQLADAQAQAKKETKLVFIEYGREL